MTDRPEPLEPAPSPEAQPAPFRGVIRQAGRKPGVARALIAEKLGRVKGFAAVSSMSRTEFAHEKRERTRQFIRHVTERRPKMSLAKPQKAAPGWQQMEMTLPNGSALAESPGIPSLGDLRAPAPGAQALPPVPTEESAFVKRLRQATGTAPRPAAARPAKKPDPRARLFSRVEEPRSKTGDESPGAPPMPPGRPTRDQVEEFKVPDDAQDASPAPRPSPAPPKTGPEPSGREPGAPLRQPVEEKGSWRRARPPEVPGADSGPAVRPDSPQQVQRQPDGPPEKTSPSRQGGTQPDEKPAETPAAPFAPAQSRRQQPSIASSRLDDLVKPPALADRPVAQPPPTAPDREPPQRTPAKSPLQASPPVVPPAQVRPVELKPQPPPAAQPAELRPGGEPGAPAEERPRGADRPALEPPAAPRQWSARAVFQPLTQRQEKPAIQRQANRPPVNYVQRALQKDGPTAPPSSKQLSVAARKPLVRLSISQAEPARPAASLRRPAEQPSGQRPQVASELFVRPPRAEDLPAAAQTAREPMLRSDLPTSRPGMDATTPDAPLSLPERFRTARPISARGTVLRPSQPRREPRVTLKIGHILLPAVTPPASRRARPAGSQPFQKMPVTPAGPDAALPVLSARPFAAEPAYARTTPLGLPTGPEFLVSQPAHRPQVLPQAKGRDRVTPGNKKGARRRSSSMLAGLAAGAASAHNASQELPLTGPAASEPPIGDQGGVIRRELDETVRGPSASQEETTMPVVKNRPVETSAPGSTGDSPAPAVETSSPPQPDLLTPQIFEQQPELAETRRSPDLAALARSVFPIIRRMLEVEKERSSGNRF